MDNGNKVFNKLFLRAELCVIENHEFTVVLFCNMFKYLKSEPTPPVSVSANNFCAISRHDSVQYPHKSFSFEVKSTSNIFNKFMVWIAFSEIFDLIGEIISLVSGT